MLRTVTASSKLTSQPGPGPLAYVCAEFAIDPPLGTFVSELGLQAGDADQDFDFDQLDLVQVQVASKYLSGHVATWGEGDWNGAPGGNPGNPPQGDGLFNQLAIVAAQHVGI